MRFDLALQQFNRVTAQAGPHEAFLRFDPTRGAYATERVLAFTPRDAWYSTVVRAAATATLFDRVAATVQIDTGELRPVGRRPTLLTVTPDNGPAARRPRQVITTRDDDAPTANGQLIGDAARTNGFVREAFVSADLVFGLTVDAGLFETRVGDGFVFDGTALGGRVQVDFDAFSSAPLTAETQVAIPQRLGEPLGQGVVAEAQLTWRISLLESVGLFAVGWWDDGSGFDDTHGPWLTEVAAVTGADSVDDVGWISTLTARPTAAETALHWFGARGEVFVGDVLLGGRALINLGGFEASNPRPISRNIGGGDGGAARPQDMPTIRYDALGVAGDLRARWLATDAWMLEAFGVYLSGARNPFLPDANHTVADPHRGFLAIAPLLTHTNLFFNGGINQTFNGRLGQTAGVLGHGVAAAGATAQWTRGDWTAQGTAAVLGAPVPSTLTGGRLYGVELDAECAVELTRWLALSAEYDVLFGGDFWRSDALVQRGIIGLDLAWSDDV